MDTSLLVPARADLLTTQFGPINCSGGERCLNVAITRARLQMRVVASHGPSQLDVSGSRSRGVHLLRRFLAYAEQEAASLVGSLTAEGREPESPFEQAVATALAAHGLEVVAQVGVGAYRIDLAIRDAATGRYVLGIECDGATARPTTLG